MFVYINDFYITSKIYQNIHLTYIFWGNLKYYVGTNFHNRTLAVFT